LRKSCALMYVVAPSFMSCAAIRLATRSVVTSHLSTRGKSAGPHFPHVKRANEISNSSLLSYHQELLSASRRRSASCLQAPASFPAFCIAPAPHSRRSITVNTKILRVNSILIRSGIGRKAGQRLSKLVRYPHRLDKCPLVGSFAISSTGLTEIGYLWSLKDTQPRAGQPQAANNVITCRRHGRK
jgi:hypothetical protein